MSKLVSDLELPPLFEKANRAMKEAVAGAIAEHWRAGRPVHIWKDGQVVALYPDGTCVPESEEGSVSPDGAPSEDR